MARLAAALLGLLAAALASGATALAAPATLTPDGAWCWFGDPRAVYHEGAKRQTYVGWIDTAGNIKVAAVDAATGATTTSTVATGVHRNDHANPSLLVLPDDRIAVFWSFHNGPAMNYRISTSAEDVRSWGALRTVGTNVAGTRGYTYPNPIHLPAENRYWLLWRGGNAQPTFSTSSSLSSWAGARTLIQGPSGQRPYLKAVRSGDDTIHLAFTRSHPNEALTGIYYLRYRAGVLSHADGTRVAGMSELPVTPDRADAVYLPPVGGPNSWIHDIATDSAGRPVIVYARFPSATDHRYHYARWTGSQWIDRQITAAGPAFTPPPVERYYSGGVVLDHEDPSVVYLSRKAGATWEVERWATSDGGSTWSSRAITSGSSQLNVRPFSPWGAPGGATNVFWMRGTYANYTNFSTAIMSDITLAATPSNRAPTADASASPTSGPAPLTVRFDAGGSSDPDGDSLSYSWDFGDGSPASSAAAPTHEYGDPSREYTATLTVRDGKGGSDTDSVTITTDPASTPPPTGGYRATVLATPGLVSYWRLGESSGTTAADAKASNHGTYAGGASLGRPGALSGDTNTAAGFDGVNDEVSLPGSALGLTTAGTVEGLFKWSAGVSLVRDSTSSGGWILAFDSGGSLAYRVGGVTFVTSRSTSTLRDGAWHHVALTVAGGTAALYVDGQLVRSATGAGIKRALVPWHAMRNGTIGTQYSRGDADELAIYSRALSAAEVQQHHAAR